MSRATAEKALRAACRENREMEAGPARVVPGEPGQFAADARRQKAILARFRACYLTGRKRK